MSDCIPIIHTGINALHIGRDIRNIRLDRQIVLPGGNPSLGQVPYAVQPAARHIMPIIVHPVYLGCLKPLIVQQDVNGYDVTQGICNGRQVLVHVILEHHLLVGILILFVVKDIIDNTVIVHR